MFGWLFRGAAGRLAEKRRRHSAERSAADASRRSFLKGSAVAAGAAVAAPFLGKVVPIDSGPSPLAMDSGWSALPSDYSTMTVMQSDLEPVWIRGSDGKPIRVVHRALWDEERKIELLREKLS